MTIFEKLTTELICNSNRGTWGDADKLLVKTGVYEFVHDSCEENQGIAEFTLDFLVLLNMEYKE